MRTIDEIAGEMARLADMTFQTADALHHVAEIWPPWSIHTRKQAHALDYLLDASGRAVRAAQAAPPCRLPASVAPKKCRPAKKWQSPARGWRATTPPWRVH